MPVLEYKCPNCGGGLELNPVNQKMKCPFCLSEFEQAEIERIFAEQEKAKFNTDGAQEEEKARKDAEFSGSTNIYRCQSCGAEIMADDTTAATFCLYCHNPVVLSARCSGDLRPSRLVPFMTTKEQAISNYKAWCGKKWFVPKEFKAITTAEKISGVYIPFWLADCSVNGMIHAEGKKIRSWTSGNYRYTETRIYDVSRKANGVFRGIPADGSSKAEDGLMDALEPFDYSQLKEFSMNYLSGFLAEKYDVDRKDVFPRIKSRVDENTEAVIRNTMHYDSVRVLDKNIVIEKTDWEYVMMPVWFMTYKYNEKDYYFAMNGETGKVTGILPLSKKKLFWASCLVGMIGFILGIIGGGIFL